MGKYTSKTKKMGKDTHLRGKQRVGRDGPKESKRNTEENARHGNNGNPSVDPIL